MLCCDKNSHVFQFWGISPCLFLSLCVRCSFCVLLQQSQSMKPLVVCWSRKTPNPYIFLFYSSQGFHENMQPLFVFHIFSSMKNPYHTAVGFNILECVENQCRALLLVRSLYAFTSPSIYIKTTSKKMHVSNPFIFI